MFGVCMDVLGISGVARAKRQGGPIFQLINYSLRAW